MKTSFKFSLTPENNNGWNNQPLTPDRISVNTSANGDFKADSNPFTSLFDNYKTLFEAKKKQLYASADLLVSELKLSIRASGLFIITSLAAIGISLFIWFLINAFFVALLYVSGVSILLSMGAAILLNCLLGVGLIKATLYYKKLVTLPNTRYFLSTFTQQSKKVKE